MVLAKVYLVDGGYDEFKLPDSALETVTRLLGEELSERDVIHQLLTDDWAAPPKYVELIHVGSPKSSTVRLHY